MLEIGSVVDGKYKVLNIVGKGGMSVVYLVMNEKANKQWAIKEVRTDGVQDSMVVRQNLMADVNILKNLNHPHLPSIVDIIDRPAESTFLIVMDYIEGRPLSSLIKESGAQSEDDVIDWAKQLCDVFGYLHSRKPPIIYRDMKPSNVMLKPDGNVMVIDFGTAREYKGGKSEDTTLLGTKGYAAPEQYGGNGETDARTDIYNLGATMYHLLTGVNPDPALPPYYGMVPDIREINPRLSFGISRIVAKCTANRPEDRYQSAAELYYDLENPPTPSPVIDIKWRLFLTSLILTVVMALGTVGFAVAHAEELSSTYDSYIQNGKDCTSREEAYNEYVNAIEVDPGNYEAYACILDLYTDKDKRDDGYGSSLDYDEFLSLFSLINAHKDELESAENIVDYADYVALPLGEYLAFDLDYSDPKTGHTRAGSSTGMYYALQYLDVAREYATDESDRKLADLIYEVSDTYYYDIKDSDKNNGDGNDLADDVDVNEYWNKLKKLKKRADNMRGTTKKNTRIAAIIYNNITSQLLNNYKWFAKYDQVSADEISELMDEIEQIINSDEIAESNVSSKWLEYCQSNIDGVKKFTSEQINKEAAK